MLPGWFRGAQGTASVAFIVMAAAAWLLLPFAHAVDAVFIPPVIVGGIAFAGWRVRRTRSGPAGIRPYPRS